MRVTAAKVRGATSREILENCLAGRTRLINRVVTGLYDGELRPLGIRAGQLTILALLDQFSSLKPAQLVEILCMERSAVHRTAHRMIDRGWLKLERVEGESGQSLILTPRGADLMAEALPAWRRAQHKARELLGGPATEAILEKADSLIRVPDDSPNP